MPFSLRTFPIETFATFIQCDNRYFVFGYPDICYFQYTKSVYLLATYYDNLQNLQSGVMSALIYIPLEPSGQGKLMESELNKINCIKMGGLAMPQWEGGKAADYRTSVRPGPKALLNKCCFNSFHNNI